MQQASIQCYTWVGSMLYQTSIASGYELIDIRACNAASIHSVLYVELEKMPIDTKKLLE